MCVWNQAPLLNQQILKRRPLRALLETGCCSTPRAGEERVGRPFNKNVQSGPLVGGSCLVKALKALTQRCHTAALLLRFLLNLLHGDAVGAFMASLADGVPQLCDSDLFVFFIFYQLQHSGLLPLTYNVKIGVAVCFVCWLLFWQMSPLLTVYS